MFVQITDQVKRRVLGGDWQAGTEIPSIRALAAELSVSVITVKRAYADLEQEGFIVTTQGRRSFVADKPPNRAGAAQKAELTRLLNELVELAALLGWSQSQLQDALKRAWRELGT
jgi:GntR family transcriptional regulator